MITFTFIVRTYSPRYKTHIFHLLHELKQFLNLSYGISLIAPLPTIERSSASFYVFQTQQRLDVRKRVKVTPLHIWRILEWIEYQCQDQSQQLIRETGHHDDDMLQTQLRSTNPLAFLLPGYRLRYPYGKQLGRVQFLGYIKISIYNCYHCSNT